MTRDFTCPKCSFQDTEVRYCKNKATPGALAAPLIKEFLSCCCRRCKYRWTEFSSDSSGSKPGDSASGQSTAPSETRTP